MAAQIKAMPNVQARTYYQKIVKIQFEDDLID
jgi:hypothetical protein